MKLRIAAFFLAIFLMGTATQGCAIFKEKCDCPKFDSSKKKKRKNL